MTLPEQAAYLASLSAIFDSIDDAGVVERPAWLVDEYNRVWQEFKDAVAEEKRKRNGGKTSEEKK